MRSRLLLIALLTCLLAGCSSGKHPIAAHAPAVAAATRTARPTAIPVPTATVTPTTAPSPYPTSTRRPTTTPRPTATPKPVPITEADVLAGYQAWTAAWGQEALAALTDDAQMQAWAGLACPGEALIATNPTVSTVTQYPPQGVLHDELRYYLCDPNYGRYEFTLAGDITLEQRGDKWVVIAFVQDAAPPPPPPPTRGGGGTPPPPPPPPDPNACADAAARALSWINVHRQANGVAGVAYEPAFQYAANVLAQRFYETNRNLSADEMAAILQANGAGDARVAYLTNDVRLQWGGCNTDPNLDPADLYAWTWQTDYMTTDGGIHRAVVGYYGPYAGSCGPSVTLVVVFAP